MEQEKFLNAQGLSTLTSEVKKYIDNASPEPGYTPTTAADFKFNSGVITAYTGNATEIVIPRSYSLESETITVNGAPLSDAMPTTGSFPSLPDYNLSLTFTDGFVSANVLIGQSVWSWDGLQTWFNTTFTRTPTLTYATGSQYSLISLCFADSVGNSFIQFPAVCNGQTFNTAIDLSNYCQTLSSPYNLDFSGEHEITIYTPIDGTDYNVTSIGDNAVFGNKTSIKSLVVLNNITSIGASVFNGATNLERVEFEKNSTLTTIGSQSFRGCTKLTQVSFPNSLTTIGNQAFQNTGLRSIYIPKNVNSITNTAFRPSGTSYMSQVVKIEVDSANTIYDSRNNCNCIVETATNKIIQGCNTSTIPNTITTIGTYAFAFCNITKSLTIPSSVTSIETYAFYYATLTGVTTYATSIGNYAFGYCRNMSSLTLNSGVTTIGNYSFQYCSSLSSLNVPATVTALGTGAFNNCTSLSTANLRLVSSSVTLSSASNGWFYNCRSILALHIPSSVSAPSTAYGGQYWRYYSSSGTLTYTADL